MNKYSYRKGIISAIILVVGVVYIVRLFMFQIASDDYKVRADNNSQRIVIQHPSRGLIYDRNHKLLVDNQAAYDLMVLPRQLKAFDTTELVNVLGISKEMLDRNMLRCKQYSKYRLSILLSQVTSDKYAILQEKLYRYPGFYIQKRTLRKYHIDHSGGVFGYVSEVNTNDIKADPYYAMGDYIGKTGIERTFEHILRGKKGKKILLVDNFNREKGSFANGAYDEEAIVGEDLYTTLDIDLQAYAIQLMQNKKGGIIAIEPATGEILAKVSTPGYDPKLMVGTERNVNYPVLRDDPLSPLFDRTTSAMYPPGSIFKPLQALVGLQTKAITSGTKFACSSGANLGSRSMGCHSHPSPLDLREAIEHSCNPYFAHVFQQILRLPAFGSVRDSYTEWRKHIISFGLGNKVSKDFREELPGDIPVAEYYDRELKTKQWHPLNIISLAIGQGELLITPLQMANMTAAIANRGHYFTPHIVRPTNEELEQRIERHETSVDPSHFSPIIDAMQRVISHGTGRRAKVDSIAIAGKTGTVQNALADHSVFIAFAPVDNPKIALVVYVENGGWGSNYAAPIAGLLMERYLKGYIPENRMALEKEMFNGSLINVTK